VAPSIVAEFLKEKKGDVEFLVEQLEDVLKERIRGESVLMKEGRMLVQCQQVSLLSWILVAWVPVSLLIVSIPTCHCTQKILMVYKGVMSMNITDPSLLFRPNPSNSITQPNVAAGSPTLGLLPRQTAPSSTPTQTAPLLSAISILENTTLHYPSTPASSPYTFPFPLFVLLLLFLSPLALFTNYTLSSTLHLLLRSTHGLRNSHAFTPVAFVIYYILTYWVLPLSTASLSNPHLRISSFVHAGDNPISTPSFFISAIIIALIFLTNLSRALRYTRPHQVLVWLLFGILLIGSYATDFFSNWEKGVGAKVATGLSLSGVVPNLYLLGVWSVPRGCKLVLRCGRRRKEKVKSRDGRRVVDDGIVGGRRGILKH
jgi:hypothetical protein